MFLLNLELLVQCLLPVAFIRFFLIHGIFSSNGILCKEAQYVKQTRGKNTLVEFRQDQDEPT